MRLFINSLTNSMGVIPPDEPLYDQTIFGVQAPDVNYSGYRMGGNCVTNNGVIIVVTTAFYTTDNNDGEPSDCLLTRSIDNGATWQDSQVIVVNNGVVPKSRVENPSILCDRSNNRVWVLTGKLDEDGNLTAQDPAPIPGTWDYDMVMTYSDDDGLTWSVPISVKDVLNDVYPNMIMQQVSGPISGFQTQNGNLVFIPYFSQYIDPDIASRYVQPVLLYSEDNGATWIGSARPEIDDSANETSGFEIEPNVIYTNSRGGSNRRMYTTSDFGATWSNSYNGTIINNKFPAIGCLGSVEIITTTPEDMYLFSYPTTSQREHTSIYASKDLITWVLVHELHIPSSKGYSDIVYYDGLLSCIYEATVEGGAYDGDKILINHVNLSYMIDDFYGQL